MTRYLFILLLTVSCRGASWYVDNEAAGSNNGTSWTDAWTALTNVVPASISSGDTIFISGGSISKTYTESMIDSEGDTVIWQLNKSGVTNNPITITVGTDSGHNGIVYINGNQNQSLEYGIKFGSYTRLDGGLNTNIWLINCVHTNDRNVGIAIYPGSTDVKVYHIGVSNWNNGVMLKDGRTHEVYGNYFTRIVGDVAIGANASVSMFGNVKIHHNYISCSSAPYVGGVGGGGADGIKPSRGADIYNNIFMNVYDTYALPTQHPDAVQFTAGGNYTRIYNNRIYSYVNAVLELGMELNSSNVFFVGNVVSSISDPQMGYASHAISEISYDGTGGPQSYRDIYFLNNTFVDCGPLALGWQKPPATNNPTVTNFWIVNNIFLNSGASNMSYVIRYGSYLNTNFSVSTDESLIAYNAINSGINGKTGVVMQIEQGVYSNIIDRVIGTVSADPFLTSYTPYSTNVDLRLQSTSPCIHAGTNLTAIYNLFGLPLVDYSGTALPSEGAWDIGAYQYVNTGATYPPQRVGGWKSN